MEEDENQNDDECSACKYGGDLLCCDGCCASWHLYCLQPPLQRAPAGEWFCPSCIKQIPQDELDLEEDGEWGESRGERIRLKPPWSDCERCLDKLHQTAMTLLVDQNEDMEIQLTDFDTIHEKLQSQQYLKLSEFEADIELIWSNLLSLDHSAENIDKLRDLFTKEWLKIKTRSPTKSRRDGSQEIDPEEEDHFKPSSRGSQDGGSPEPPKKRRRISTSHEERQSIDSAPPSDMEPPRKTKSKKQPLGSSEIQSPKTSTLKPKSLFEKVFYRIHFPEALSIIKTEKTTLEKITEKLMDCFPKLKDSSFTIYYIDSDGIGITIFKEECLRIFYQGDSKDLMVKTTNTD